MPFVIKARNDEPRPELPLTPAEAEVANIVRTTTDDLQVAAMSNAVRDAITSRNYEAIVNAFPWDQTAETLGLTEDVFGRVIQDAVGGGFPKMGFKGRFDYTDPRALEWAKKQSAQLVTAVTDSTRRNIQFIIGDGFTRNLTVKEISKNLSEFIGLNERQAFSYQKFINNLDEQVRAGKITTAQMRKMSERQYKKMIKYRAQMIARQEIIMAENNGRYLGFTQAVENGWADPKSMKRWSASTDERTCEICGPMNGKSVQWDKPYPNGVFNPPAHIMCRCTISLLEPDSSLAQNFMTAETEPVAPLTKVPMPDVTQLAAQGVRSIQDGLTAVQTGTSKVSGFQYDAGDIENLNVTTEMIEFNGVPSTELRFKLTGDGQGNLYREISKTDDWRIDKGVTFVDRRHGDTLKFAEIPDGQMERAILARTKYDVDGACGYMELSDGSKTFTRYFPDGTAVRFVQSPEAYALNGQVRVIIPGKATPEQVHSIMKRLQIAATRAPSEADILALKEARIVSLFDPTNRGTMIAAKRSKAAAQIAKKWGFTLDELTTTIDTDGSMRVLLPDHVAKKVLDLTDTKGFVHSLGNYMNVNTPEEAADRVVGLFQKDSKLLSQVQRKARGNAGFGISEEQDMVTGGADYVFARPIKGNMITNPDIKDVFDDADLFFNRYPNNVVYDTDLIKRTDWFAYSGDSYGVKNPKYLDEYWHGATSKNATDYIGELTQAGARSEIMFQDSIGSEYIRFITVKKDVRPIVLERLKAQGITEWNGRKIEDVIVAAKGNW